MSSKFISEGSKKEDMEKLDDYRKEKEREE
jgi:hypothetical protein